MADPVYGPGGSGYYTDPATGQRVWQTRTAYGPNSYQATDPSVLVYDPSNVSTTGSGTPTTGVTYIPAGTTGAPGTGLNGDLSSEQKSAKAILADTLNQYGLGGLADRAWGLYLGGEPIEQVMLELRNTDEYKARFPAMAALSAKGHAISEGDYINLEKSYQSLSDYYDLPQGFVQSHITGWITGEASPNEINDRFTAYQNDLYSKPAEVRSELTRLYGLTDGDQLAAIANPDIALPLIENKFFAAQKSAAAIAAGYGQLGVSEAERLNQYNVSYDQAVQGFGQLSGESQLFTPLAGDAGETAISRADQQSAEFGGNANAARRIQQRARKRAAVFQESGGYQKGGYGTAQ